MSVNFRRYRIRLQVGFGLLLFVVFIIVVFGVYLQIKPALLDYASAALYQKSYYSANEVMRKTLAENGFLYDDLVELERKPNGEVTALKTNTQKLNTIKTETLSELLKMLRTEEETFIRIPIGNFMGSLFFSGRGPRIPIKLLPVTSIEAEYQNRFTAAGINQTQHEIMMHITINTGILYPSRTIEKQIELDLCLAETIFIGTVPEFYAGIE